MRVFMGDPAMPPGVRMDYGREDLFGLGQTPLPLPKESLDAPMAGQIIGIILASLIGAFFGGVIGQIAAGLGSAVVPLRVKIRNGGSRR